MGLTLYYRSTEPVSPVRADAIRRAADASNEGRTWLSCEPVNFFDGHQKGHLFGGSKPSLQRPAPENAASAARQGLPDGTVRDLVEVLCALSRDHGVDWEFSHDYDAGPIGFIRRGVCDHRLRSQIEAFADVGAMLSGTDGSFDNTRNEPDSYTMDRAKDENRRRDDDSSPKLRIWREQD